jgi:hypothetical protein
VLPREAPLRWTDRPAARPLIRHAPALRCTAIALVALAVFAVGCGGDDDGEDPAPVNEGTTELTIVVDPDGEGGEPPAEALLQCPGAEAPPAACAAVAELPGDATAPVPPSTPCTEIFGGPDLVTLEGTLEGEQVDTELTRANGCEIERFERFLPVLEALFPEYEPGAAIAP